MIEVFKTNITNSGVAVQILNEIHNTFPDCSANFDLDDCDNILRVVCNKGTMEAKRFIQFLNSIGCIAEILSDNIIPSSKLIMV